MAQGKKSFVLYTDLIKNVEHLTLEEKGLLFDHLLKYVNDLNPVLEDRLVLTAWKPIESQLKRDLIKFEEVKVKRSEAGKKSAELRQVKSVEQNTTNSTSVKSVEQNTTNSTDNVNDSVNDNVNDSVNDNVNVILLEKETKNIFSFSKSLKQLGAEEQLIKDWLAVRKNKKATNTQTAFNSFEKQLKLSGRNINEVLTLCVEKSWSGFKSEWLKDIPISLEPIQGETDEDRARRQYIERIKNNDY